MKKIVSYCLVLMLSCMGASEVAAQTVKYKCLLQLINYTGEGAYIVVSLINPKGEYEKTLRVMGADKEWYPDIKEWHKAQKKKPQNVSAVTGASVGQGDRTTFTFDLDQKQLNAGYKIRFESAVENKEYFVNDVEIPLTTESLAAKTDGKGYIRYVRFSAN